MRRRVAGGAVGAWAAAATLLLAACEGDAGKVERREGGAESSPRGALAAAASAPVWSDLVTALGAPDATALQALLARGCDAAQEGPQGQRALVLAGAAGRVDLLRVLLEQGQVPIDQREEERGETALMAAAGAGHEAAVDLLLAKGADPSLVGGVFTDDLPVATARGLAAAAGHEALAAKLEATGGAWEEHQGALVLMDRITVSPVGVDLPVQLTLGRQEGRWGRLVLNVHDRPVALEDDATSLGPARRSERLFRIPLTWKQGREQGRQDVLFNQPNAGEDVMAAVLELPLPRGHVRLEIELRPLHVE